jgi:uncharacterized protein (DUF1800 family)
MVFRFSKAAITLLLMACITRPSFPQSAPSPKKKTNPSRSADPSGVLGERQRALHALNRLTFGPRPGDLNAVVAKGLDSWMEDQLHPESMDDSALNSRLAAYATTRMGLKQMAELFPSDNAITQIVSGKRTLPTDPLQKMISAVQLARIEQQKANQAAAAANATHLPKPESDLAASAGAAAEPASPQDLARAIADRLLALPKEQRLADLENQAPERLIDFPAQLRADQRERLLADFTPEEREVFRALAVPRNVVANELQQAKLIREIYSERQLQEVMTDFWVNHFNVFQYKDQCVYFTTAYERDTIRPHALGKFYDLLVATAQSPAMLVYLDNWLSIGPHSQAAGKNGMTGLNENYGRELMELHTLGVDGGYTQADVSEFARVMTGWTVAQPEDGAKFQFDARRHDPGVKTVLGQKFYEAGVDEGLRALDMLAHQPATAHFVSQDLAMRFVSDNPPEGLVKRMAATFLSTDGDIREVLRTMLKSPEFWAPKFYGAKFKTPLEFVVSAIRASGADVTSADSLVQSLNAMGMRPYGMEAPAGYSMKAETWQTEGALLARINFSTALTQGKLAGVQFDAASLITRGLLANVELPKLDDSEPAGVDRAIALTEEALLNGDLSVQNHSVIRKQMQDPQVQRQLASVPLEALRQVAGFVLASPDFQRR